MGPNLVGKVCKDGVRYLADETYDSCEECQKEKSHRLDTGHVQRDKDIFFSKGLFFVEIGVLCLVALLDYRFFEIFFSCCM